MVEVEEYAMMKNWTRDTLARVLLIVGLLIFVNWALSGTGHGIMDVGAALVLVSLFLVASTAARLWRVRHHLSVVTSLSQVRLWSVSLVILGLVNAWTYAQEKGAMTHEQTFFWSTIAATSFVGTIVRPQAPAR